MNESLKIYYLNYNTIGSNVQGRPLPDSIKFARRNFEQVWVADGTTLEALFRKLKSLEDLKTGQLAGKICTVIDLVTRLPVEIWFHTNPSASDTNFEAVLLNLLTAKTLILLDRGFYHFLFFEKLINQNVNFITRLKAKASIKILKVLTYDYSVRGCLKSWQLRKKSSQGISCKYVHTAPLRAMSKVYPSNLTQEQWELLEPLIPAAKPGGRKREADIWEVLNAIFYVLCEGCRWRSLPGDFPNWQTVYTYFRNWRKDGTWVRIHDRLREWVRVDHDREPSPSEAIIDSQSVKSAAMVSQAVGYDAGKQVKGRKRFLTVDTLGLVLRVLITAASVGERQGGKEVLLKVKQMGPTVSRLHTIWVDAGFDGNPFMQWVMDFCRWIVQVVLRPKECKKFVLLPKRWVVERTFGWLTWCRRLNKDYELLPETAETFVYLAMIRIMLRQLA